MNVDFCHIMTNDENYLLLIIFFVINCFFIVSFNYSYGLILEVQSDSNIIFISALRYLVTEKIFYLLLFLQMFVGICKIPNQ